MTKLSFPGAALALLLAAGLAPGACGGGASDSGNDGHPGQAGMPGSGGSGGGSGGSSGSTDAASGGDSGVNPGGVTASSAPFDAKTAFDSVRKVKNLLIGLAPTDAEVAAVEATGAAGLQKLIISWTTDSATQSYFENKMLFFFTNTFQQTGFTPTVNFMPQLLENGGFDFGPLGVAAVGGDVFAELVQNLQSMFARTAWYIVNAGQPFTNVLTTQGYMMTTGLVSLYLQIEMPNDQPYSFTGANKLTWQLNYSGNPIALTDTLNPSSANYMVFDDVAPTTSGTFFAGNALPSCRGGTAGTDGNVHTQVTFGGAPSVTAPTGGYAQLWQRLLGFTPRWPFLGTPDCWEHPSQPYFSDADMSDWRWVNITALPAGGKYIQPYDIPTLETTTTLPLALPRIGFYTTPAYLAIWNTNDSNQHRVTTNQTLLAALGESFTSADVIVPVSEVGLDADHSVTGTQCYGCHKSLDPMRNFWANQFDFNDRNDFLTSTFNGAVANPRPTTTGGVFAFGNVNMTGASILNLGGLIEQVTDGNPTNPINQFAEAITQKLCFYANSTACDTTDTEFRQIASDFASGNYNFPALIKELFSSTLVTGTPSAPDAGTAAGSDADSDAAAPAGEAPISISRRDHFCDALSNRLGVTDICSLAVPLPNQTQTATATIAGAIPDDNFSRGSQFPITPSEATLFFRAGVEELCENLAPTLVTASSTLFPTGDAATAITNMVQLVMGYPASDPHYAQAVQILTTHQTNATAQGGATTALESTFVLACESPTSVSIGL
jgi:hypothetical protein